MREYDIYLPLHFNDGSPVPEPAVAELKATLVNEFGGLTHFPQQNEGLWKFGNITYRDRIVILRVLSNDASRARRFLTEFKACLQRELRQTDVLVIEREVSTVG